MNIWWESSSGLKFRRTLAQYIGSVLNKEPNTISFDEVLDFVYVKTKINPNVIKKWKNGGNPSLKNIEKILDVCGIHITTKTNLIDDIRNFKRPILASQHQPPINQKNEFKNLTAIINEFNPDNQKYWVRVYDENNKFVYGDRVIKYNFVYHHIKTPAFRQQIINKLGHNNFNIYFNKELSIPEMQ